MGMMGNMALGNPSSCPCLINGRDAATTANGSVVQRNTWGPIRRASVQLAAVAINRVMDAGSGMLQHAYRASFKSFTVCVLHEWRHS